MNQSDQTFTDIDEFVTVRSEGGTITVAITAAGFRQPLSVIAGLVTELAGRLQRPGAETDEALAGGIEAIGRLQQTASAGGYEAFTAMMRSRLGIEGPAATLSRDPEFDRTIAQSLDGVLKSMRDAAAKRAFPSREVHTAEVHSEGGDIAVSSSTERAVAGVWLGPDARRRGVDGLNEELTRLIAEAREAVEQQGAAKVRDELPEGFTEVMDKAPEQARQAEQAGLSVIEQAKQMADEIRRRTGRA